jgi:hypothetical protein
MPYADPESDDPMSLNGIAFETTPEVAIEAAYTYAEEFARAGHEPAHILLVFRSPQFQGPYSAFQVLGAERTAEIVEECSLAMAACRTAARAYQSDAPIAGADNQPPRLQQTNGPQKLCRGIRSPERPA